MKANSKIVNLLIIFLSLWAMIQPQKTSAQVSVNFQVFYDDLSHYGRWYSDPVYGPMWVPDYEWGPGWVTRRRSEGYYGWAPIEPGIGISLAYSSGYEVPHERWTFVRSRDFGRSNINSYYVARSNNVTIINNTTVINKERVDNTRNASYNGGPDRMEVEKRSAQEEIEWANYLRSGDSKGIMQWRKMTDPYANLLKGNSTSLAGVTDTSDRFVGYAESHDEERVNYKALTEAGQTQNDLAKVHLRASAMGAVHLLVPGPKMIWHFGPLGWEKSLWTCENGNVSFSNPDCKLDTKPQPQWTENWLANTNRSAIYNNWSRMIDLKKSEPVFENGTFAWNFGSTGHPRLDIWTSTTQTAALSYAYVLTYFTNTTYNVAGGFPFVGTWANLMDNSTFSVTDTNMNISIEPGGFRVFGNKPSTLSIDEIDTTDVTNTYPNPSTDYFYISNNISKVEIFSITGQLVKSFANQVSGYQYNVSDLKNGMYMVKIVDENNRVKTTKLLKQ